ncbi:MAG: lipid-A-disaccharide synthase [Pseudomonadales bacterium]
MDKRVIKIGVVAGERSGDALGAGLLRALRARNAGLQFSGLGGEAMIAAGLHSIADMQRLSVMGIIEPLKRLPDLFALRRELREHFVRERVELVVTIDSPDFNLGLARQLRQRGISTCHYVCPSVWAWRQRRVHKIAASVDHVLCLLPFEQDFLARHGIAATFIGHPLADQLQAQVPAAGDATDIDSTVIDATDNDARQTLCLMPGSRESEVDALLVPFLQVALACREAMPGIRLLLPAATASIAARVRDALAQEAFRPLSGSLELRDCSLPGASQAALREASVVLLASGTATLEAALLGIPMVVAYRMSPLGFALAKRLVKVDHIALPNLLLGERVVPELVQHEASPVRLAGEVLALLQDAPRRAEIGARFDALRRMLARGADDRAADLVLALAECSASDG